MDPLLNLIDVSQIVIVWKKFCSCGAQEVIGNVHFFKFLDRVKFHQSSDWACSFTIDVFNWPEVIFSCVILEIPLGHWHVLLIKPAYWIVSEGTQVLHVQIHSIVYFTFLVSQFVCLIVIVVSSELLVQFDVRLISRSSKGWMRSASVAFV